MKRTRDQFKNCGSAMVWVVMLLLVATIMISSILPLAAANMTASNDMTQERQAYLTAKSVTDMIVEYLTNNVEEGTGKELQEKAINAGAEGTTFDVTGLESDMGTCKVTMKYENSCIEISSTAEYGDDTATVGAILQKEVTVGNMEVVYSVDSINSYGGICAEQVTTGNTYGYALTQSKAGKYADIYYTKDAQSDVVFGSAISEEAVVQYFVGSVQDTKPITCNFVSPIISQQSVSLMNDLNQFQIVPTNQYEKVTLSDGYTGDLAIAAQGDVTLLGKIDFGNPRKNSVRLWANSIKLTGNNATDQQITTNGYHIMSATDIFLDNVSLWNLPLDDGTMIQNQLDATSQILLTMPTDHGTSVVEGLLNCAAFQISGDASSDGNATIGDVVCDSAAVQSGNATAVISSLQVTGDVYLSGNVHVDNVISGGNVTLNGSGVTIDHVACTGQLIIQNDAEVLADATVGSFHHSSAQGGVLGTLQCAGSFHYDNGKHGNNNEKNDSSGKFQLDVNGSKRTYNRVGSYSGTLPTVARVPEVIALPIQTPGIILPVGPTIPPDISVAKATELSGSSVDNLKSNQKIHCYKISSPKSIPTFTLDSHGDTYLFIDGVNVSIGEIKSNVYYGNLYLILENKATLTLGSSAGIAKEMKIHILDLAKVENKPESASKLVLENGLQLEGTLDVTNLVCKDGVVFTYATPNAITGSFNKDYARWRLVQYTGE